MCQTARLIEGHPHASSGLADAAVIETSSAQDTWISELIEMAYKNNELLRPEEWSQQMTNRNDNDNNNNKNDTNDNTDHGDDNSEDDHLEDDHLEDDHSEDDHSEDNSEEDNSEEDTSKKQESSNDKIMQYRKRKLLQGTFTLYQYRF